MNATFEAIAKMNGDLDRIFANLRARPESNFNPPCHAGCFHCCNEALMGMEQEVDYMLDMLTPEQIEELKPRVAQWLAKAKDGLQWQADASAKFGIKWRLLNVTCPFLIDGQCSVYARRPVGCRTFFAHSHAENCEMPHRTKQKFAEFSREEGQPNAIDIAQAKFVATQERLYSDHVGIHLARKLLGLNIRSGAAQMFHVEPLERNP